MGLHPSEISESSTQYIPATQEQVANLLSPSFLSNNEWSLSPSVFNQLSLKRGSPQRDLVVTPWNSKRVSPSENPYLKAEGVDFFQLGYSYLPMPLISRFLAKLRHISVTVSECDYTFLAEETVVSNTPAVEHPAASGTTIDIRPTVLNFSIQLLRNCIWWLWRWTAEAIELEVLLWGNCFLTSG